MTERQAYPAILPLPGGTAHLVIGSVESGPRYEIDGVPTEVNVAIPDDLVQAGWIWWGSFLHRQHPAGECGISIDPGTYPPPPIASGRTITIKWTDDEGEPQQTILENASCFDVARNMEQTRARLEVERQAQALKPAKRKKRPVAVKQAVEKQETMW